MPTKLNADKKKITKKTDAKPKPKPLKKKPEIIEATNFAGAISSAEKPDLTVTSSQAGMSGMIFKKTAKKLPYIYAVGRRKTAIARVRLYTKENKNGIIVNEKNYSEYFPFFESQLIVESPLKKINALGKYYITVRVQGGGKKSQAEAVRHGIARTLLIMDESLRKTLRGEGFLTRDSRRKERKKPGLKRARRAPQWQKR